MSKKIIPLEVRLRRQMVRAIRDFNMIEEGDRIMVAISGGKDSYALLHLLRASQRKAKINFEILAVHLDQVQPGYDGRPMVKYLEDNDYDYRIVREDTYSIVVDKVPEGKTYCSLCSRLRRGILYTTAVNMGCTKIALGHHRDDLLETFLLNALFAGQLKTMPPKLVSDDRRNVIIRPLAYVNEEDIVAFSEEQAFPIIPCNLCGSQQNMKRDAMTALLTELDERWPGTKNSMMAALLNPRPSHLPAPDLWRRLGLPVAATLDPKSSAEAADAAPGDDAATPVTPISEERIAEELGF